MVITVRTSTSELLRNTNRSKHSDNSQPRKARHFFSPAQQKTLQACLMSTLFVKVVGDGKQCTFLSPSQGCWMKRTWVSHCLQWEEAKQEISLRLMRMVTIYFALSTLDRAKTHFVCLKEGALLLSRLRWYLRRKVANICMSVTLKEKDLMFRTSIQNLDSCHQLDMSKLK